MIRWFSLGALALTLCAALALCGCAGAPATPAAPTPVAPPPTSAPAPTPGPSYPPPAPYPAPATPAAAPISATPVYTYTIVNAYSHDPTAYTEGLVYDGGVLYEGTGIEGRSTLRRVALDTGEVLQTHEISPTLFGEGVAVYSDTIVQLTWKSHLGFVYNKSDFSPRGTFSYPTEGWGIAWDGARLIMSDGTATLRFLDPTTFAVTGQIDVSDNGAPVVRLNELEYIRGEIYANVWQTDRVARIDPATGRVLAWIDLSGLLSPQDRVPPAEVLNGIAYDAQGDRLFVTGKLWPKLFEIRLAPKP